MKTQLKQHPERAVPEQATSILAAGRLAHIAFVDGEQPYVVPMSYHYDPQEPQALYLHGALKSRALQIASSGAPLCVEVSLLDGLVYSRTALYHSMNYRSVMGFGRGAWIEDQASKDNILAAMIQRYFLDVKAKQTMLPPSEHLKATGMVRVEMHNITAKAREGGPKGPTDQETGPGTAGVIPTSGFGQTFQRGEFTISTDPALLDLPTIHALLRQTYWASELALDKLQISVEHSLCFGLYHQGQQIGFTRVLTDWVRFAYLADVVIEESYRGQGLGQWLMETILTYPGLEQMRRWLLKTRDAQPFYQRLGFGPLSEADGFMEILNPKQMGTEKEKRMTNYRFYVTDVFTHQRFGGNQLAVIPEAEGLSTEQMQQIAREFNFSETTFVNRPQNPQHTAHVRIFTPLAEIPFAGHPTLGTAFVLSQQGFVPRTGLEMELQLEEGVGVVPVRIQFKNEQPDFLQLTSARLPEFAQCPEPLEEIATALGIAPHEISTGHLAPAVVSCGLPFLIVPLKSLATLQQLEMQEQMIRRKAEHHPHWRSMCLLSLETVNSQADLHVRMFAPWFGVPEDPATGSAAAALAGYLGQFQAGPTGTFAWTIEQGLEMGRPSRLYAEADKTDGQFQAVRVGGQAVLVMEGQLYL